MTSKPALIWMQNTITINHNQLGPCFWPSHLQAHKHVVKRGYFSEGQEPRNIGLADPGYLIVLILDLLFFDVVDHQPNTGYVWFIFIGAQVDSTDESNIVDFPIMVIFLNDLLSDFNLLLGPLIANCLRHRFLKSLEF